MGFLVSFSLDHRDTLILMHVAGYLDDLLWVLYFSIASPPPFGSNAFADGDD
ncbi:hypothetical protein NITGR_360025 [Nitrospina gracilis 3/211]|uniref:Uncharacterized protein n=1 Tax=Nitrospina gracilis (strain 3/211) TaxID=1266370 RepID=M1YJP4_NITG3|nr:hypothetical protein NITGR_360025 [Nitrospina gracilis 3/211]